MKVIECPRCGGTWWSSRIFHQILAGGEANEEWGQKNGMVQPPDLAAAIVAGQDTPLGMVALVTGHPRVLYVCGKCSWPGIEPFEEPPEPNRAEYVLVRR